MSHTYLLNGSTNPAIVAGSVTAVQVAQDAVWVVFHNVSVNQDILLSLGVVNPGPTSTPGGEWPYVCPAGHSIKVPVPGTSKTETAVAPYWQGKIWVLPISLSSQQAVTGQQPPIGNLWIMTFANGETPAEVSPNSTGVTQLGQQRVVSVPASMQLYTTLLTSLTSPFDTDLTSTALSATVIANSKAVLYLYYFQLLLTVQAAVVGIDFQLFADIKTAGGVVLTSVQLLEGLAYSGTAGTFTPFIFAPALPGNTSVMSWSGTAATARLRLHVSGVTAGSINAKITWGFSPDEINAIANGAIGYFAGNIAALF